MSISSAELDQIVRVVMQRLAVGRELVAGMEQMTGPQSDDAQLVIDDRLVTMQSVEVALAGKRSLRVHPKAIVTPAVLDLLRERKIQLVRGLQATRTPSSPTQLPATVANAVASSAARIPPVLVCGSAIWFESLPRHLCPQQAVVESGEDAGVVTRARQHRLQGGRHTIWLTAKPFAAAAAVHQGSDLVAIQLPSLLELAPALEQTQPQLMIIDASKWTVAAVGNLVRTLARAR